MDRVVIQGASRGLGLGFVRALLARNARMVHATCRNPDEADELRALAASAPERLMLHRLDVRDEASIARAAEEIRAESLEIGLVINASGILHGEGQKPERRLEELDPDRLLDIYSVNSIGPLLVVKHLLPQLMHAQRAVVASLSARVGSIGDNRRGGWYGYRSSKAALNQLHRSLAIELTRRAPNVVAVTLHPGTVATRLTEPFRRSVPPSSLLSVDASVTRLLEVIGNLTKEAHGGFFDYAGKPIEW